MAKAPGRSDPGIAAVAKAANVSYMTVSRVVNGRPGVGAATRQRVQNIMDEMGYTPNMVARALRTGKTRSVGIVCFATTFHGPASTLFAVEQSAREAGYSAKVVSLTSITEENLTAAVSQLRESAVDAVIVISPHRDSAGALRKLATDVPVVAIWAPAGVGVPVIAIDHASAAAAVTEHLLDLGHPTVWHVSGPLGWTGTDLRVAGWQDALEKAGRPVPDPVAGDWTARSGYDAGKSILRDESVSAVFAANDQMALGFAAAARQMGRTIPDDLSIVGYDDEPGSEFFVPPLTTVRQDFRALGERAFEFTLALIRAEPHEDDVVLDVPTSLVIRESTAPYTPRHPAR
jgi:DNA-binding LacI/PurR family transcriptional regulator